MFQFLSDEVCIISPEGLILNTNEAFSARLDKTQAECIGINIFDLLSPELAAQRLKMVQEAIDSARPISFEAEGDGQLLRNTIYPCKSSEDNIDRLLIISQDITDIERSLQKERFVNKHIINSIPGTFYILDAKGKFVAWNEHVRDRSYGVPEHEMPETFGIDIFHPDDRDRAMEALQSIIKNDSEVIEEFRIVPRGGTDIQWRIMTGKKMMIDDNPFVIGVGIDITDRKHAEEALQESENWFKTLFEEHPAAMITHDPVTGYIVDANQAAAAYYGWSVDELRRMSIQQINTLSPEAMQKEIDKWLSLQKRHLSFSHRRADGSIRNVEVFAKKVRIKDRDLISAIIHDVTERNHHETVNEFRLKILKVADNYSVEELLRFTLDEAEKITESSIGFIHFVEADQTTLSLQAWSTNTLQNMCKAESKSQHYPLDKAGVWADAIREQKAIIHNDYPALKRRTGMPEGHAEIKRELVVPVNRDGKIVAIMGVGNKQSDYVDKDIELVGIIVNQVWDIVTKKIVQEENKQLAVQLQHASKMEMIGQLAAGIAHEINNPLNFITLNAHTIKEDFQDLRELIDHYRQIIKIGETMPTLAEETGQLRKKERLYAFDELLNSIPAALEKLQYGIERISAITNSMRSYSFKNVSEQLFAFDLNKAIREALVIAKHEYSTLSSVALNLEELPQLFCDPAQINQVILNMIINSCHAIKSQNRNSPGNIEIKTWSTSESVFCSVTDDGPGIPETIISRVFEPFFTTKDPGKGTGLGLSISYDIIVNKHKGSIFATSLPEGGTVFTFTLPVKLNGIKQTLNFEI